MSAKREDPLAARLAEMQTRYDDVYTALVEATRLLIYAIERTRIESPRMDGSDWGTRVDTLLNRVNHIEQTEPK